MQKEEYTKTLTSKIKSLETECKRSTQLMNEAEEKFNQDIIKRSEDLEFYKRSYEEQKNRVNKEHELISTSLFDLAKQFMTIKSELQKKSINSNNA
jgi:hypothetical protein